MQFKNKTNNLHYIECLKNLLTIFQKMSLISPSIVDNRLTKKIIFTKKSINCEDYEEIGIGEEMILNRTKFREADRRFSAGCYSNKGNNPSQKRREAARLKKGLRKAVRREEGLRNYWGQVTSE